MAYRWRNMFKIKVISVGKIKKSYWADAIFHYKKMLCPMMRIDVHHVKDSSQAQHAERKRTECERILEKLNPKDRVLALHEKGTLMNSIEFATFLRPQLEDPHGECCFVVGGAMGLSPELLGRAQTLLSLSPMTMPHELAQVVLYEQLFRAVTIMANRTYHY